MFFEEDEEDYYVEDQEEALNDLIRRSSLLIDREEVEPLVEREKDGQTEYFSSLSDY